MRKKRSIHATGWTILILVLSLLTGPGCWYTPDCLAQPAFSNIHDSLAGQARIQQLLYTGMSYLARAGEESSDLDSALLLTEQASKLAIRMEYRAGVTQTLYQKAHILIEYRRYHEMESILPLLDDSSRSSILQKAAEYRIFSLPRRPSDIDTAILYTRRSETIARRIHSLYLSSHAILHYAFCYCIGGDIPRTAKYVQQAVDECASAGQLAQALQLCADGQIEALDLMYPALAAAATSLRGKFNTPQEQRMIADYLPRLANSAKNFALNAFQRFEYALAYKLARVAMDLVKDDKTPSIQIYLTLFQCYLYVGPVEKAITFGLETLRVAEARNDTNAMYICHQYLGTTYVMNNMFDRALDNFEKLPSLKGNSDRGKIANYILNVVAACIGKNDPAAAMRMIDELADSTQTNRAEDKILINTSWGNCYLAMKQFDKAGFYFRQAERISRDSADRLNVTDRLIALRHIGQYYFDIKEYDSARMIMSTCLSPPFVHLWTPRRLTDEYYHLSRADSAVGDYSEAIRAYETYDQRNDSIFNSASNRLIEELSLQYETEKKNEALEIKNKKLSLLYAKKRLELDILRQQKLRHLLIEQQQHRQMTALLYKSNKQQQQSSWLKLLSQQEDRDLLEKNLRIQFIHEQQQLRTANLLRIKTARNGLITGILFLSLLATLLYNGYLRKRKVNRLLKEQQENLNNSHLRLRQLNEEQQKLLTEKEWLVKEIHHRVKNNLQIITSLMDMQTEQIKDADTLDAVGDINHLMFSISLIHQKLYRNEHTTQIGMSSYLQELISYLKDNLQGERQTHIRLDAEDLLLDAGQCMSVGLILTGLLTEAFRRVSTNDTRHITISFTQDTSDQVQLVLKEEGSIWLPAELKVQETRSSDNTVPLPPSSELLDILTGQMECSLSRYNDPARCTRLSFSKHTLSGMED